MRQNVQVLDLKDYISKYLSFVECQYKLYVCITEIMN